MTWGPFVARLDDGERRCRLRALRVAAKLIAGERSLDLRRALIVAEGMVPDDATLAEAERAFEAMSALDRRRVLSGFVEAV